MQLTSLLEGQEHDISYSGFLQQRTELKLLSLNLALQENDVRFPKDKF